MPLRTGETFAGYRVLRLLGSGGMGEVYLVQHPRLPRQEALKVLRPDISSDPSFRERFIREADLAAGLRHPHIVGIHDRGEHDGQLWIAMDYIDGTDAAELLRSHPSGLPVEDVATVVTAIASALDYAHKRGLLHRDVKPANIIVADLDTDDPKVFLADFGIARPVDDTTGITTTNMTVGTVAYAAPEQLMGKAIDGRADQYALAATAYNLVTGAVLYPDSNPVVVISHHLSEPPPAPSTVDPALATLDATFDCALAKKPEERFTRCQDFAREFVAATIGGDATSPSTPTQKAALAAEPVALFGGRRNSPVLVTVAAILVLGVLAAGVTLWRPWADHGDKEADSSTTPSAGTTASTAQTTTSLTDAQPSITTANSSPAPPPPPPPPVTITATPTATISDNEAEYIAAIRGLSAFANTPASQIVVIGRQSCKGMDKFPGDTTAAAAWVYPGTRISYEHEMTLLYAANYLCPEHSAMWGNY